MKNYFLFLFVVAGSLPAYAQFTQDPGEKYASTITSAELKSHLTLFAGDYFEGRETGTIGLVRAAEYISTQFKEAGIQPLKQTGSYYKEYPLIEFGWESAVISDKKNTYAFLKDFYGFASSNNSFDGDIASVVFLGYGIDDPAYSDYADVNVEGKVVMVATGEPMTDGRSLITKSDTLSDWATDWRKKVSAATKHKAACILIVDPQFSKVITNPQWIHFLEGKLLRLKSEYKPAAYCSNFYISQETAEQILGKKKKLIQETLDAIQQSGKPANFSVNNHLVFKTVKTERVVYADNVFGYVEGSDLAEEVVVVSAHYDHLGKINDTIYNGADDDGSGTVALIEMAEAMMLAKADGAGPRRSVLFIAFSGEEKGLLGSKAYVEDPVFELKNTVADLNIDMIGRVDESHATDSNYVYVIGSNFLSTALHTINEAAAKTYTDLSLDYKYNSTTDPNRYYYRSDHYNFAKNNIPVIFYFSGTHEDYHQSTDDVEKINFSLLEKRAKLVFHTLWIVANQDARIAVDVVVPGE